jgi:hypothetical protein
LCADENFVNERVFTNLPATDHAPQTVHLSDYGTQKLHPGANTTQQVVLECYQREKRIAFPPFVHHLKKTWAKIYRTKMLLQDSIIAQVKVT